jgi:hypothetical protein
MMTISIDFVLSYMRFVLVRLKYITDICSNRLFIQLHSFIYND